MSKIGDALKDYDREILEEEDIVAEIVKADEFTREMTVWLERWKEDSNLWNYQNLWKTSHL